MNDQLRRRSVGAPAARSALLTVLGEFVVPHEAPLWRETLVQALEILDYTTTAARQAMARSVSGGWLRSEPIGRRTRVSLTPDARAMLQTGAERIYSFGHPWTWDGRWLLVIVRVPEHRRDVRHQLRTRLAWAGFGSLGGGLWVSPHVERQRELPTITAAGELLSFEASVGAVGDSARVLAAAWDLGCLAEVYRDFADRFGRQRPRTAEAIFRAHTELVHEWRKFPFMDPDLPEDMLPAGWPRQRALKVFQDQHARWHVAAREHFAAMQAERDAA